MTCRVRVCVCVCVCVCARARARALRCSNPPASDPDWTDLLICRCKEFAEITGTNPTLGWFFLQDRDWDVARSVDAFFEQGGAEALGGDADAGGATGESK